MHLTWWLMVQVAAAAFSVLDALVEWMSCQLVAKSAMADSAARADITVVLRDLAANLALPRAGLGSGGRSSVKDSPMEFERAEKDGGPLQQALLWLSRSQKSAHRCVPLTLGEGLLLQRAAPGIRSNLDSKMPELFARLQAILLSPASLTQVMRATLCMLWSRTILKGCSDDCRCKRLDSMACRVCFASLVGALAQAAHKPQVMGFHAETLVRPLLRMARYVNSAMQSAAFLALGHLMSYPAAQQVVCEVRIQSNEFYMTDLQRSIAAPPCPSNGER